MNSPELLESASIRIGYEGTVQRRIRVRVRGLWPTLVDRLQMLDEFGSAILSRLSECRQISAQTVAIKTQSRRISGETCCIGSNTGALLTLMVMSPGRSLGEVSSSPLANKRA